MKIFTALFACLMAMIVIVALVDQRKDKIAKAKEEVVFGIAKASPEAIAWLDSTKKSWSSERTFPINDFQQFFDDAGEMFANATEAAGNVVEGVSSAVRSAANRIRAFVSRPPKLDKLEKWIAWATENGKGKQAVEVERVYGDFIRKFHADSGGVAPEVAIAKIAIESGGNAELVGGLGELGPLQTMPSVGAHYGITNPEDLQDPMIGCWVGLMFLRDLKAKFGSDAAAIIAYGRGEGGYQEDLASGQPAPEKRRHWLMVKAVDHVADSLKRANGDEAIATDW